MSDTEKVPRRDDAIEAVTWPVRVAAAWSWRLLVIGVGLYVLAQIFLRIELVAFSFVLALFFTAVLHPLERVLRRVPGPRSISALLALLIGLGLLAGIGYFVTWQITTHSSQLGDQVSAFVDKIRDWLHSGPLHLKSSDLDKITANITNDDQEQPEHADQRRDRHGAHRRRGARRVPADPAVDVLPAARRRADLELDGAAVPARGPASASTSPAGSAGARSAATCAGRCSSRCSTACR